jgi:hypothetical protein
VLASLGDHAIVARCRARAEREQRDREARETKAHLTATRLGQITRASPPARAWHRVIASLRVALSPRRSASSASTR